MLHQLYEDRRTHPGGKLEAAQPITRRVSPQADNLAVYELNYPALQRKKLDKSPDVKAPGPTSKERLQQGKRYRLFPPLYT